MGLSKSTSPSLPKNQMENLAQGIFKTTLFYQVFHFTRVYFLIMLSGARTLQLPEPKAARRLPAAQGGAGSPGPRWGPLPKNSRGIFHLDGIKALHGVLTSNE